MATDVQTSDQLAAAVERVRRRPVFWDQNAGGWCWQLPGRAPVQAESWALACAAIRAAYEHGHSALRTPPAPATTTTRRRRRGWFS